MGLELGDVAALATAFGVALAAISLWRSEAHSQTQLEDRLAEQYRAITAELPLEALLGKPIPSHEMTNNLRAFYRYLDLSNEQVYLRMKGRVRRSTWREWSEGMRGNFRRPAFKVAWTRIRTDTAKLDFDELARAVDEDFAHDPRSWT
jgi:hypothetical protein